MKNYLTGPDGIALNLPAPALTTSGGAVQIGFVNAIAVNAIDTDGNCVLDTARKLVSMPVRNVLTYAAAIEDTHGAISVGDKIYYDRSDLVSGVRLSTSPKDKADATLKVWGIAMSADATTTAKTATIKVMIINPAV